MPIYEYECEKCKERFEVLQSVGEEDNDLRCPKCNARNLQRVLSVFSSASSCDLSGPT